MGGKGGVGVVCVTIPRSFYCQYFTHPRVRCMNVTLHTTWPRNPFPQNTSVKWPNFSSEVFIPHLLLLFLTPPQYLPLLLLIPCFLYLFIIAPSLYSPPNTFNPHFSHLGPTSLHPTPCWFQRVHCWACCNQSDDTRSSQWKVHVIKEMCMSVKMSLSPLAIQAHNLWLQNRKNAMKNATSRCIGVDSFFFCLINSSF